MVMADHIIWHYFKDVKYVNIYCDLIERYDEQLGGHFCLYFFECRTRFSCAVCRLFFQLKGVCVCECVYL